MKEECLICKAPLEYLNEDVLMECAICHKKELSKTRCVNGHYVCNECLPALFGSPCWTRTNDPIGQKHSRLARLERFAMLVVSSCSEHRFICRRQRGAPSQLTAGAAVCGRVDGLGQQVK